VAASALRPGVYRGMLDYLEACHRQGLPMYASAICMDIPVDMTLAEFNMFDVMPNWVDPFIGSPEQRAAKLRRPEVRAAMKRDLEATPHQAFAKGWTLIKVLQAIHERNHQYEGLTVAEVARRMDKEPLDAMLDLALDEGLQTVFGFLHAGGDEA